MSITNKLNQIKNAIYGKEVRGAIHDAIKECYDDATVNHDNANMEVKMARGTHNTLNDRLNKTDEIQAQTNAQLSKKATKLELDIERKRINTFTTLKDGSTTGDAELIDGRIGADGVVYSNIGDAMRNQFNKVTKSIDDLETLNEIHPLSVEKGRWGAGGNLVESELFFAITYLVIGGESYYLNGHTLRDSTFKIFFVNDSDSIVSAIEDYQSSQPLVDFKLIAPNDATKMKITIENANNRVFYVTSSNTKNTSNLILNANNKIEEIINDGEIKPLQVVADNRWGAGGNLVPEVGFNAYKYSVTPNETYYIDGYEFAHGFLDKFGSYTYIVSDGYKNYREILIPSGVYYLCVSESNKGDGNIKLFKSPINSRIGRAENLKKDGIVTPTEFVKNARWGGNDGAVSTNNYNLYKYSVVEGEKFYLKGYTLKDRTSRIGFKYFDGTFGEHTDFQPQPLNFYEITVPKKAIMMYITETDEASGASFELYSTGIIKKTLDLVEKRLEVFNDYPSYYQDHLEDRITQYQNIKYYTDSDSFVFITDLHYKENTKNSVGLINGIVQNTDLRKVFSGGDLVYAYGTTQECKDEACNNIKYFNKLNAKVDFCAVRGNHDFTIKHTVNGSAGYTAPQHLAYNSIMSNVTDKAEKTDELYYYLDNKAKKIRYVFVDTNDGGSYSEDEAWGLKFGMSEKQINWLKNEALRVEDEWLVVVIGHVPCVKEIDGYVNTLDPLANILKDYKNKRNEFEGAKGEFVAYICGHNHKDMDTISDNTTFISTGCDAAIEDDIFDRKKGTVREQLFDIFIINKIERKIKTIRVGAGNNREFSY